MDIGAANANLTLTIPPLPFSNRFVGSRSPMIEVYRNTQADQLHFYYHVPTRRSRVRGSAGG
jgi:hypothetical protein